ncbi:MAG: sugar nucleotide-binding protein [Gammaproteobacteria bacterium]|nr:sugar nucleotide-binding protein [Gammaproteobacteria bacterium]
MKLLIYGSNSQTGLELTCLLDTYGVDYVSLATDELDVLNAKDIIGAVGKVNPTQLINVSTYANLQNVESDPEAAKTCELINTDGVASLGRICEQLGIPIIHHSSSYVFDGKQKGTYTEEDKVNPQGRYGKSKWYGERALKEEAKRHIILRTDWLFSSHRHQYFERVIAECKVNKGKVRVVDNRFSPTHAYEVARAIYAIVKQIDCNADVWGTYHYNAMQPVNQGQFVQHLLEEAAKLDKALDKLLPSLDIELLPVELPYIKNSALNCEKLMATFGIKQRARAIGIKSVLDELYGVKKPAARKKKSKATVKAKASARKAPGKADKAKKKAAAKKQAAAAKKSRRSQPPAKKAAKQK